MRTQVRTSATYTVHGLAILYVESTYIVTPCSTDLASLQLPSGKGDLTNWWKITVEKLKWFIFVHTGFINDDLKLTYYLHEYVLSVMTVLLKFIDQYVNKSVGIWYTRNWMKFFIIFTIQIFPLAIACISTDVTKIHSVLRFSQPCIAHHNNIYVHISLLIHSLSH